MTSNICIVWLPQKIGNLMTFVVTGYFSLGIFQYVIPLNQALDHHVHEKSCTSPWFHPQSPSFGVKMKQKSLKPTTLVYNCIITWNSAKWSPNFWAQLPLFLEEGGPEFAQDQAAFSR